MRFEVSLRDNPARVHDRSEELLRGDLDPDPVVGRDISAVGGVEAEPQRGGFVVIVRVAVLGGGDGVQARGAGGQRVVGDVDPDHVGEWRRGRRVRRGARRGLRRRGRALDAQPAYAGPGMYQIQK